MVHMTVTQKYLANHQLPAEAQMAVVTSQSDSLISQMLFTQFLFGGITDEVFDTLIGRKLDVGVVTSLAHHCTTPERVNAFLAKEKRTTAIAALLNAEDVTLNAEQLDKILSGKLTKSLAEALVFYISIHDVDISEATRLKIMKLGARPADFIPLLYRASITDEEMFNLLSEDDKWLEKLRKENFNRLEDLLTLRPGLLNMFLFGGAHFALAYAATASHLLNTQELQNAILEHPKAKDAGRLFTWGLSRLAWNPRCTPETLNKIEQVGLTTAERRLSDMTLEAVANARAAKRFDKVGLTPVREVSDEVALRFFLSRNAGNFARFADGEILELLQNPNLSVRDAAQLCQNLIGSDLPAGDIISYVFYTRVAGSEEVQEYEKKRIECYIDEQKEQKDTYVVRPRAVRHSRRNYNGSELPLSEAKVSDLTATFTFSKFNPMAEIDGLSVEAWTLLFLLLDDSEFGDELEPLVLAAAATC